MASIGALDRRFLMSWHDRLCARQAPAHNMRAARHAAYSVLGLARAEARDPNTGSVESSGPSCAISSAWNSANRLLDMPAFSVPRLSGDVGLGLFGAMSIC